MKNLATLLLLGLALLLPAVGRAQPLAPIDGRELPALAPEGDLETLKVALTRQIKRCAEQNPALTWNFAGKKIPLRKWCTDTSQAFLKLAQESADFATFYQRARSEFQWYRSTGSDGKGLVTFTGYYFPHLRASLTPNAEYRFPIYRQPSDLVPVTVNGKTVWRRKNADGSYSAYFDRDAIDFRGAIEKRRLEIAYARDYLDVYGLQVQGSGALMIEDPAGGPVRRMIVGYAASNGHAYVSLRKILQNQGVDARYLNWPGMRLFFQENPGDLRQAVIQNPSYVFFQESKDGPYGVGGMILSPGHSVAIDTRVFPVGAMSFVSTQRPEASPSGEVTGWKDFSRFALTQDTGGAIKGAGRVDIYWGEDRYAETAAGLMNQPGALYFAVKRD